jgi:transcriptional regulator GlxA family with amidase domain
MEIAVLTYDGMTALDAVGPAQVLALMPDARVRWVAEQPGPKRTDCGMAIVARHALTDVQAPEVILVPGALDVRAASTSTPVLEWLRAAHATSTWTTSVCTGALVLGAAGLLRGLHATTHWAAMEALRDCGAEPVHERVVREGKIVTAAGVAAGIDMALTLVSLIAGRDAAETVQLGIEYDPQPPFDAGSPRKARPEIMSAALNALLAAPRSDASTSRA